MNLDLSFTLGQIASRLCALEAKAAENPLSGSGKLAFMANTGTVNSRQTQIADLVRLWNPNAAFVAGGGWSGAGGESGLESSYAAFNFLSASSKLYPALGNSDVLDDPLGALTTERFKAVTGEARYYSVEWPDMDLEVFVLNTASISGVAVEPDGVEIGEGQYLWLVDALKASTRKWRVVVSSSPYSVADDTDPALWPDNDWQFQSLGVHLVISSSEAPPAHIQRGASHLVHLGGNGTEDGFGVLNGATDGTFLVWRDPGGAASPSAALLTVSKDRLWLDITDAATSEVIHSLCIPQ